MDSQSSKTTRTPQQKQFMSSEELKKYEANAKAHKPGMKNRDVIDYYSNWKCEYERDLNASIYRGPQIAADFVNIFAYDKQIKILDVGAGTGFVGERLVKHGFKNIDALEPSDLIEMAISKFIYSFIFRDVIQTHMATSIPENSYDIVVMSGAFGEGHIPCEGVNELLRVCKPNGHVIIVMREEYLATVKDYSNRLEPLMDKLVRENKWFKVLRLKVANYSFKKDGIVFVFQKNAKRQ